MTGVQTCALRSAGIAGISSTRATKSGLRVRILCPDTVAIRTCAASTGDTVSGHNIRTRNPDFVARVLDIPAIPAMYARNASSSHVGGYLITAGTYTHIRQAL